MNSRRYIPNLTKRHRSDATDLRNDRRSTPPSGSVWELLASAAQRVRAQICHRMRRPGEPLSLKYELLVIHSTRVLTWHRSMRPYNAQVSSLRDPPSDWRSCGYQRVSSRGKKRRSSFTPWQTLRRWKLGVAWSFW